VIQQLLDVARSVNAGTDGIDRSASACQAWLDPAAGVTVFIPNIPATGTACR